PAWRDLRLCRRSGGISEQRHADPEHRDRHTRSIRETVGLEVRGFLRRRGEAIVFHAAWKCEMSAGRILAGIAMLTRAASQIVRGSAGGGIAETRTRCRRPLEA